MLFIEFAVLFFLEFALWKVELGRGFAVIPSYTIITGQSSKYFEKKIESAAYKCGCFHPINKYVTPANKLLNINNKTIEPTNSNKLGKRRRVINANAINGHRIEMENCNWEQFSPV